MRKLGAVFYFMVPYSSGIIQNDYQNNGNEYIILCKPVNFYNKKKKLQIFVTS